LFAVDYLAIQQTSACKMSVSQYNNFQVRFQGDKHEDGCFMGYFTVVSEVFALIGTTEVTRTFDTSGNFYQSTRRNIPEDSHLVPDLNCA
jgi:hypothetical protein